MNVTKGEAVNTHRPTLTVVVCCLCLTLGAGGAWGKISEPDHILYGTVTWFGEEVEAGTVVSLALDGGAQPLTSYVLGSNQQFGNLFVLRVPLDAVDARTPGTARPGEVANILVNGELAGEIVIGERGTARLLDVDPADLEALPSLTIGDVSVVEGDAGTVQAVLTITLSPVSEDEVTVDWVTENGTAVGGGTCGAGVDFLADSGMATILPGNPSTTVSVTVCGEEVQEADELFFVDLGNPTNATLLDPQGKVTIVDDDTPPRLSVNNITVPEPPDGEVGASFRVSLSKVWEVDVTFSYTTTDGTARAGDDYVVATGVGTIPAGSVQVPVPVTVLSDDLNEDDETFFLDISNPVNASIMDGRGQAIIVDSAQFLVWLEAHFQGVSGVEGLAGASASAVSPDGRHVYVAGRSANAVALFDRDTASGELVFVEAYTPDDFTNRAITAFVGLGGASDVAVSADGHNVYVAASSDNAVAVFARETDPNDPGFGTLTLVEVERDGVNDLNDTGGTVDGLAAAAALALSPQDPEVEHLYVAGYGDDAVAVFERVSDPNDPDFGRLSFLEVERDGVDDPFDLGGTVDGLHWPVDVVVSADGAHVYVAGQGDNAVAVFERDTDPGSGTIGELSFLEVEKDGASGVDGLAGAAAVALDPAGSNLYAAGYNDDAVAVFERVSDPNDADFGRLSFAEAVENGADGVSGLLGASGVAVSEDGGYVYAVGYLGNALAVFARSAGAKAGRVGELVFIEVKTDNVGGVDGLFGATSVTVTPGDGNVLATGYQDSALAVFARDLTPPVDPSVWSTTHAPPSTWHNTSVIGMAWSGASDIGGAGLAGYSFLFDTESGTTPDATVDMWHGDDPHTTSSATLTDGVSHYFHLRTCDHSQNCTTTVHAGPYWIDTTPPLAMSQVVSLSHEVGVPSYDETVDMQWDAAGDPGDDPVDPGDNPSGVVAYSYTFNQNPVGECNYEIDASVPTGTATSLPLKAGYWYFHICAVDAAGNWGPPATAGPYEIINDTVPPKVIDVSTVSAPEESRVTLQQQNRHGITQLLLTFSKHMFDTSDPNDPDWDDRVTNPANYRLVFAGPDALFQSATCSGVGGDDALLPVSGVEYDDPTTTAALHVGGSGSLPMGWYRVMACGSNTLYDINGNPLDGNGDGVGGDDFFFGFLMERTSLLLNPNFDDPDLTPEWGVSESSLIGHSGVYPSPGWADADDAITSSSVKISRLNDMDHPYEFAVNQCVALPAWDGSPWHLSGRVRVNETLGGDPGVSGAFGEVVFYNGVGCSGSNVGQAATNIVLDNTSNVWLPLSVDLGVAPGTATWAQVSYRVRIPDEPCDPNDPNDPYDPNDPNAPCEDFPFDAWFDNLLFQFSDNTPPIDPNAASTSHTPGVWSNNPVISVQWQGAADSGVGVKGYSYLFNTMSTTQPDTVLEQSHTGAIQSAASSTLADGIYYFHLRTCDWVGNCSSTVHLGPFPIERTAPANPTGIASTTHTVGVSSVDSVIGMAWTQAVDKPPVPSGVAGYAHAFNSSTSWPCSQSMTLPSTATTVESAPLANGTYYFHICTVDNAGNWSASTAVGPYIIFDDVAPRVTAVGSVASTDDGVLDPNEALETGATQLLVTFSEPVYDPAGDTFVDDVTNPDNIQVVAAGPDGVVETDSCLAVQGDDVLLAMDWVMYDLASRTAAAKPAGSLALAPGRYRLIVCGSTSITDHADNRLDGDGNGTGGDDMVLGFEVTGANRLTNPNLDEGLGGWTPTVVPPSAFTLSEDDAGDAFSSGSAALTNLSGPNQGFAISQCLDVTGGGSGGFVIGGKVRLERTGLADPTAFAAVDFYPGAGCTGGLMAAVETAFVVGDTGGWATMGPSAVPEPEGAVSALVSFLLQSGSDPSAGFGANLDDLYLMEAVPIFVDGFESGDLGAWSDSTL